MIRIAICDDDLEMLKQLSAMTNNYMQKRAVRAYISTFADAQSMLAYKDPGFDIILLDIRMDGLDGLEAAKLLRKQGDESVLIFVSSILEYAPRGYEVDAFRFILKSDLSSTFERCMSAAIERLLQQEETFRLPSPQGDHWTQLKNIIFIESMGRQVIVHLKDGPQKTFQFYEKISDIELRLAERGFVRVQRSYLVNMEHILVLNDKQVIVTGKQILPVGGQRAQEVMQIYTLWKGRVR